MTIATFENLWSAKYPDCEPRAEILKDKFKDGWLRLHTLAQGKRYAESDKEQATILARYNAVLEALEAKNTLFVLTCKWSDLTNASSLDRSYGISNSAHLLTLQEDPEEKTPEFVTYRHVFVGQVEWSKGCLDGLLTAVSKDETAGVIVTPQDLSWLYHPYDGGIDIVIRSDDVKQRIQQQFASLLP